MHLGVNDLSRSMISILNKKLLVNWGSLTIGFPDLLIAEMVSYSSCHPNNERARNLRRRGGLYHAD
jgi:hypothetical protein